MERGGGGVVTPGSAGGGKRRGRGGSSGRESGLGGVAHPTPVQWKPRAGLMSFSLAH